MTIEPEKHADEALFDSFAATLAENPFPAYARLRAAEPIYWEPVLRAWVFARLDDVRTVLDDKSFKVVDLAESLAEFGVRTGSDFSALVRVVAAVPFFQSGERHRLSRRSLGRVLTRTSLRNLEVRAEEVAAGLVAELSGRREFDAVADFSDQVSARMMVDMLGLPRADTNMLLSLGDEIFRVFEITSQTQYKRLNKRCVEALAHVSRRVSDAVAAGTDSGLTDYFRDAKLEGDERLAETAAHVFVAFVVGTLTTGSFIAFCIDALLAQPELYDRARQDLALAAGIAAEVLRLESPVQRVFRVAGEDRVIGGVTIKNGQRVLLLLGAANRDPSAFPRPDVLEPGRPGGGDVAFGSGEHLCVGAALARLETRIALTHFLKLPRVQYTPTRKVRYPGLAIRRLLSLPVRFAED